VSQRATLIARLAKVEAMLTSPYAQVRANAEASAARIRAKLLDLERAVRPQPAPEPYPLRTEWKGPATPQHSLDLGAPKYRR
jgi:hypothetical protein